MSSYDATRPRTPSWGSSRRTAGPGTAPRPSLGPRAGVAAAGEACHPCHLQASNSSKRIFIEILLLVHFVPMNV